MRFLVVLVAALAMMTGWSGAQAAEARITAFAFGCETPEGRKLKPKFGDVEGVFYTDIPAQWQQCVEAVKRKIALCRENTDFASNTRNEKYAECLPIFREQAQACVGHFQRELVKCDGGGRESVSAVSLDPGERRRIQAVLAGEGFDPGPADGQFGPKTRRAIQAWQRANGYAATGELTRDQAETILTETPPAVALQPKCAELSGQYLLENHAECWEEFENRAGCYWWNVHYHSDRTATLSSGRCRGGVVKGRGTISMSTGSEHSSEEYRGEWRDGKQHGYGTYTAPDGRRAKRYEGGWRDGKQHGHGIYTYGHLQYEGEYRDGKRHGYWTVTSSRSGKRKICEYRDGGRECTAFE